MPHGRLTRGSEFERLLAVRARSRSAHFALHHAERLAAAELSTEPAPRLQHPVDKSSPERRLGVVVPKRHARRAVTRTLLKRLVRAAFARHSAALAAGDWLVRLKAPFAPPAFVSADSPRLRAAVRGELEALFGAVAAAGAAA